MILLLIIFPWHVYMTVDILLFVYDCSLLLCVQIEFDEKELRREITYAIKNIHGIR